jgi:hypothetical protein
LHPPPNLQSKNKPRQLDPILIPKTCQVGSTSTEKGRLAHGSASRHRLPSTVSLPLSSLLSSMPTIDQTANPTPMGTYADLHTEALSLLCMFPTSKQEPALALALLSHDYTACKTMFLDADWITPDLRRHVKSMFPSRDAIMSGTRVRDKIAFKNACSVHFKKGRIFSSPKQLKQVAALFLDKWGGQCSQHGKKIICYYHAPMKRKEKEGRPTSDRKA